jgi:muconolactone delta-isomerase
MDTMKDQEPSAMTAGQVRAACDTFASALDVAGAMLATYREMIERWRESGTFEVDDEARARLNALESDDATFATMDRLDKIWRAER